VAAGKAGRRGDIGICSTFAARNNTIQMKYSQRIGIAAALILIAACFLPWAYYPDLQKSFTGFFSEGNFYGRPGKVFVFFASLAIILFLIPRVWAKRVNMFIGALTVAFAIKSYILYTACYRGICPDKLAGIWLVLVASVAMSLATVLPDMKLKEKAD
jgi:hypothetical protein